MLYDRLSTDLNRAIDCPPEDLAGASAHLRHAQEIVAELRSSLKMDAWSGTEELAGLYSFVLVELLAVQAQPDVARLRKVADIVEGLRDAWRQAGMALLSPAPSTPKPADHIPAVPDAAARHAAWVA
jgi:flagellar protein FliS